MNTNTDPVRALPIETAPRDGTIIRLLVEFEDHATEDTEGPAWTIGHNSRDNTGDDVWQFAGWCWNHDHYTEGKGKPVGWLPLVESSAPPSGAAAYCRACQAAGMSNCAHFNECAGATCVTCHRPLNVSSTSATVGELKDSDILWDMRHIEPHLKDADEAVPTILRGVRKAINRALAQQPAIPVAMNGEDVVYACDVIQADGEWAEELSREVPPDGFYSIRNIRRYAQQPAGVDGDEVRRVAQHIGTAADYIDKAYPDANMLDRGPILRNMRRWHARLTAALAAQQQGGAK